VLLVGKGFLMRTDVRLSIIIEPPKTESFGGFLAAGN